MTMQRGLRFCGGAVSEKDLSLIFKIYGTYQNLSQSGFASTICQLLIDVTQKNVLGLEKRR